MLYIREDFKKCVNLHKGEKALHYFKKLPVTYAWEPCVFFGFFHFKLKCIRMIKVVGKEKKPECVQTRYLHACQPHLMVLLVLQYVPWHLQGNFKSGSKHVQWYTMERRPRSPEQLLIRLLSESLLLASSLQTICQTQTRWQILRLKYWWVLQMYTSVTNSWSNFTTVIKIFAVGERSYRNWPS